MRGLYHLFLQGFVISGMELCPDQKGGPWSGHWCQEVPQWCLWTAFQYLYGSPAASGTLHSRPTDPADHVPVCIWLRTFLSYRHGPEACWCPQSPAAAGPHHRPISCSWVHAAEETSPNPLHTSDITVHFAKNPMLCWVLYWVWRGWPASWQDTEFQFFSSHKHQLSVHKELSVQKESALEEPSHHSVQAVSAIAGGTLCGAPGDCPDKGCSPHLCRWSGMDQTVEEWVQPCQPN